MRSVRSGEMMQAKHAQFSSIDAYIEAAPVSLQETLRELRAVIREAAPQAEEKISYQMPTFFLKGNLVHFALFKNHIGFYPTPSAVERFQEELSPYETSRGAIRFPIDQPLPYDLIRRMVKFRVAENLEKAALKGKR